MYCHAIVECSSTKHKPMMLKDILLIFCAKCYEVSYDLEFNLKARYYFFFVSSKPN